MSVTQPPPSTAVATRDSVAVPVAYTPPLINQREIATLWELARGLAASQIYKDSNQAAQAFGKLIIGREWGFTPAQSMMLYVMEGKIEVPYPLFAHIIRQRPGYDFYIEWREERPADEGGNRWVRADADGDEGESGDYEIIACRITATVDMFDGEGPQVRARSVWTKRDSERAQLTGNRGSKTSNHVLYPRNMFLARSMSNLVKFYIPEVLNGLPVYSVGETTPDGDIMGGDGDGSERGWRIGTGEGELSQDDVDKIEFVMAEAERVGHAGLASRASAQVTLGDRPDKLPRWLEKAQVALDGIDPRGAEARHAILDPRPPDEEPEDAVVVDDKPPVEPAATQAPVPSTATLVRTAAELVTEVLHVVVVPALQVRRFTHPGCDATWAAPIDDDGTACAGAGPTDPVEGEVFECEACGEPARVVTVVVDLSPPPDPDELERQALAKMSESDAVADADPERASALALEASDLHEQAVSLRGPDADTGGTDPLFET